jgi:predicted membrane chloride channel (bestrophin family)
VSSHNVSKYPPKKLKYLPSAVWLYLFFLPFQLVTQFSWYTIPGVAMAAFIYLGFLAAGDEIAQPFGMNITKILRWETR